MPTATFIDCALLLFVLLNPFLLSVYLLDLIQELDRTTFHIALLQGTAITACAFVLFAFAGGAIFARVLQVRFASFLIFGGIVFLVVAVRYVMVGSEAIRGLRGGSPNHIAGSIARPFMIGPGTVSASVLAGSRLPFGWAALSIDCALAITTICVLALKWIHDSVKQRYEAYVDRYIDTVGRISALIIGAGLPFPEIWATLCAPIVGTSMSMLLVCGNRFRTDERTRNPSTSMSPQQSMSSASSQGKFSSRVTA